MTSLFAPILLALITTTANAATYECYGQILNATIQIENLGVVPYYGVDPIFNSVSTFRFADGRTGITKVRPGRTSPFRRPYFMGGGAYWNDETVLVHSIGGSNFKLDDLGTSFFLEIRPANPHYAKLYLGHRDERAGLGSTRKYDATCALKN